MLGVMKCNAIVSAGHAFRDMRNGSRARDGLPSRALRLETRAVSPPRSATVGAKRSLDSRLFDIQFHFSNERWIER